MMKNGALFDMDGLIFDTEKLYQETWNEKASEIGVDLSPEFKYQICGTSGDIAFRTVEKYFGVEDGQTLAEEVYRRAADKMVTRLEEKPGTRDIFGLFRDHGVKMAVASSTGIEIVRRNLAMAGIEGFFDAVISGQNLEHGKPAPDIFLLAAKEIGIAPEDCYVFEDSVSGIQAAHAGGMCPVMIPDLLQPSEEIRALCGGIYPTLKEAADAIRRGEI